MTDNDHSWFWFAGMLAIIFTAVAAVILAIAMSA